MQYSTLLFLSSFFIFNLRATPSAEAYTEHMQAIQSLVEKVVSTDGNCDFFDQITRLRIIEPEEVFRKNFSDLYTVLSLLKGKNKLHLLKNISKTTPKNFINGKSLILPVYGTISPFIFLGWYGSNLDFQNYPIISMTEAILIGLGSLAIAGEGTTGLYNAWRHATIINTILKSPEKEEIIKILQEITKEE